MALRIQPFGWQLNVAASEVKITEGGDSLDAESIDIEIAASLHSPAGAKDGRVGYYSYVRAEEACLNLRGLTYSPRIDGCEHQTIILMINYLNQFALGARQYIEIFQDQALKNSTVHVKFGQWGESTSATQNFSNVLDIVIHCDNLLHYAYEDGASPIGDEYTVGGFQITTDRKHDNPIWIKSRELCELFLRHNPENLEDWMTAGSWPLHRTNTA